jgi:TolB-like protein/Flp pilus assembly protein TadD
MSSFFRELKRRNVYRVAAAYAVVAWLLIQIATSTFPVLEIPNWATKLVIVLVVLGFPLALIFAWAFELTPEGIKRTEDVPREESISRTTGRKLDFVIIGVLGVAVALLLFDRFRAPPKAAEANTGKSVAVLPFENLSRDPDNAYFATGVQEEVLTRLAKVSELKVISRTSTQQYQSKPGNLREIAQQLGVAHIVEGSVQRAGDSVRVNVQLIKADTDAHVWAETYDRKLSEIFQVQSDIALRIADALEAKLTGRERQQIATAATTDNPRAYEAYLRGVAIDSRGPDSAAARDAYREAVQLDPNFAAAWAALANRESFEYFQHSGTPEQLARARHAMETALRLAPDAAESHAGAASFYYYCLQEFDRGLQYAAGARQRAPNSAHVILLTALINRRQGNFDRAIELMHEAANLDPRNNDVWLNIARSHRGARRFSDAITFFDRALAVTPGEPDIAGEKVGTLLSAGDLARAEQVLNSVEVSRGSIARGAYLWLLIYKRDFARVAEIAKEDLREADPQRVDLIFRRIMLGNVELRVGNEDTGRTILQEARDALQERQRGGDRSLWIRDELILLAGVLGDRESLERDAAELLRITEKDRWRFPISQEVQARAYAQLGDAGRAIPIITELLGKTYHHSLTTADLRLNPEWDRIRSDPRFAQLAQGTAK